MFEFTIYSIGDSAFLEQILNAVAILTGLNDFSRLVSIGFLIGVLMIAFSAIIHAGRSISFQHVLIGFLFFALMYGPASRVHIEDIYNGQVRDVDNVPYGVAAVGSIISSISYNATQLFEQAFSTPRMTTYGYASALEALAETRKAMYDRMSIGVANEPNPGDDVLRSWNHYIRDCTLVGVDAGIKSMEDIYRNPDVFAALRVDSTVYGTELFIGGAHTFPNCTDAMTQLQAITTSTFADGLAVVLKEHFGTIDGAAALSKVQDALNGLNQAAVSAQNYMISAVLLGALQDAIVGKHLSEQSFTHAAMAREAIEKRNTQWAAEQSLWLTAMRPLMTFFEGFIYAVTPIMGFLIAIGTFGLMVAVRYLTSLLWISSWMFVMAIVNLYIHMITAKHLAVFSSPGVSMPLPSFGGVYNADRVIQDWLATGGFLGSITPMLSLLLIYGGSSVIASTVASRVGGRDHVDEHQATPQVATVGPVMSSAPMYSRDMAGGMVMGGYEREQGVIQLGNNRQIAYESGLGAQETISQAREQSARVGQQVLSSSGESDRVIQGIVNSVGQSQHLNTGQRNALAGALSAQFAAAGKLGTPTLVEAVLGADGHLNANFAAGLKKDFTADEQTQLGKALENVGRTSSDYAHVAEWRSALSRDTQSGRKSGWGEQLTENERRSVSSAENVGRLRSIPVRDAGLMIANSPELAANLHQATANLGLEGAAQQWQGAHRMSLPNDEQRVAAGRIVALDDAAKGGNAAANAQLLGILGRAYSPESTVPPDASLPTRSARTATRANFDEAKEATLAKVAEGESAAPTNAAVADDYLGNRQAVGELGAAQHAVVASQAEQVARGQLRHSLSSNANYPQLIAQGGSAIVSIVGDSMRAAGQAIGGTAAAAWPKLSFGMTVEQAKEVMGGLLPGGAIDQKVGGEMQGAVANYAQERFGLTPEQASYYASEQVFVFNRLLNAGGDLTGARPEGVQAQRDAIGDPLVLDALERASRTGDTSYLQQVGQINKWQEIQRNGGEPPAQPAPKR